MTNIFFLLGGLGALLVGFKLLSDSIEKIAAKSLKKLFAKISNRKLLGVGIGVLATALIQSSGATTVMVVGFVNSGIMSLAQAAAVIMGANIGTTVTAQIVALQNLPIVPLMIAATSVGIFMEMLGKKREKFAYTGLALAGLGLIFLGLDVMKSNMSVLLQTEAVYDALVNIHNPFLLLFIGIILTALVQSSSAITSIILTLASAGLVVGGSGNGVLYIILGTNIGSCVTALLSSIGTTPNAKRASLIHLMFNVFGSLIFFIIFLCWPSFMKSTFAKWFSNPATQIAMFHTLFNILCTLIFLPLSNVLVKLSKAMVKDKKPVKQAYEIALDERFLSTPSIAISSAKTTENFMFENALSALNHSIDAFLKKDAALCSSIREKIASVEDANNKIVPYLVKISSAEATSRDEKDLTIMHYNLSDITRIAEIADNICKYTEEEIALELRFSQTVLAQISLMQDKINQLYYAILKLKEGNDLKYLKEAEALEDDIDEMRATLLEGHIARMNSGECSPSSSNVFINLVGNLERAGDHLDFIAHRFVEEK